MNLDPVLTTPDKWNSVLVAEFGSGKFPSVQVPSATVTQLNLASVPSNSPLTVTPLTGLPARSWIVTAACGDHVSGEEGVLVVSRQLSMWRKDATVRTEYSPSHRPRSK